jgi:S1-C subfamily serine protease
MTNLTPKLAEKLKTGSTEGALVSDVLSGSPAERAGLQPGDVIRQFDGRPVKDINALRSRLAEVDTGHQAELRVIRGGKEYQTSAIIAEAPPDLNGALPRR